MMLIELIFLTNWIEIIDLKQRILKANLD